MILIRRVSNKRARKLRKKGVGVYWSVVDNSYIWEMKKIDKL